MAVTPRSDVLTDLWRVTIAATGVVLSTDITCCRLSAVSAHPAGPLLTYAGGCTEPLPMPHLPNSSGYRLQGSDGAARQTLATQSCYVICTWQPQHCAMCIEHRAAYTVRRQIGLRSGGGGVSNTACRLHRAPGGNGEDLVPSEPGTCCVMDTVRHSH